MHSHSGQFCPGHAKDQLEDVVKHAIGLGYTTMGLTEHMPRTGLEDLYPEELDDPEGSLAALAPRHAAYMEEAQRLRALYAPQIALLVGFEGEWMRPAYRELVTALAAHPAVDYFVGSLHHVNGVPIDYDREYYARAMASVVVVAEPAAAAAATSTTTNGSITTNGTANATTTTTTTTTANGIAAPNGIPAGATTANVNGKAAVDVEAREERMYERYYDEQYDMLVGLSPRVVGHFDLIRLMSADPGRDVRRWPGVWERIERNLAFVAAYGGWLECNSSALRKGLAEPYPCRPIAEKWISLGGKFTLSDDSHGIAQLGTNYGRALDFLSSLNVTTLWTLRREPCHQDRENGKPTKAGLTEVAVPIDDVRTVVSKWSS
ncbi:putative histidinol phosphate phosphatase family protein [Rosellinia necatrix]|uniref:Histidinol-phosphatase n=1 Tax=Rosellinia necatrix TaxID=77044 RepID=A0A1W2TAX4_ROSNE|nr:putative histidinol phosphate phosphatase family protein [Rosellinia necatrix]